MVAQRADHPALEHGVDANAHTAIAHGQGWLLQSGIYIRQSNHPQYGAVYSHYDRERKQHELVYAEATGYGASLLTYLAAKGENGPLCDLSQATGEWLLTWSESNRGLIAMGIKDGVRLREAYAFDNGICCKGLLDLYRRCGDDRYLKCARQIANWLVDKAVNDDGSVKPVFHIDSGRFVEDRSLWYKASGSFHAKIAMPLLLLHSIDGRRPLKETAARILDWTVKQQRPDGSFPANIWTSAINVHFHCYTVEALLNCYAFERRAEWIEAAERATAWLKRAQRADGTLPRWRGAGQIKGRGSDVQAQAVRIFSMMSMLDERLDVIEAIDRASIALLSMQKSSRDTREEGAFSDDVVPKYRFIPRRSPYVTSWSTMFALQALHLRSRFGRGDFASEAKSLF